MPQLDFTTYSAQIFWFSICFVVLYSFLAYVIIPRIAQIAKNRKEIIEKDSSSFEQLSKEISEVAENSKTVILEADKKYKDSIADAVVKSRANRDSLYEDFAKKSDDMISKSRKQIDDVIADSSVRSGEVALEIGKVIENKILN